MRVAFVNPQGNFDPRNSYLASHPDFGGQLVYVREVARVLEKTGHQADILTRRVVDPEWPEFAGETDAYPGHENVRILRVPCGPDGFLPKEELWPYLGTEFVPNLLSFYEREDSLPDTVTSHYGDGGLCAVLIEDRTGIPFSFTAHSLGAQKMDKMGVRRRDIAETDKKYHFSKRIVAERLAMNRSRLNVTSTGQERFVQYTHNAYRGAVDPTDGDHFAAVPPGVAMHIFDKNSRADDEGAVRGHVLACLERDLDPERVGLPCIVASSRLDPKKNHRALVEAFASSPELRERANLLVITRGLDDPLRDPGGASDEERPLLDTLISTVDRSNLWGGISAFGLSGQTALAALYRWGAETGGVFCLPAEYEPFGMTVVEAMAVGLPVVVTQNGGPQETTDGGRAGLLADPHDPGDIAAKLLRLLSDRQTWKAYADKGLERARDLYNWRRTAEGYLKLAGEAARGERGGDPSFPIPEFARRPAPAGLPRLRGWETQGERPAG